MAKSRKVPCVFEKYHGICIQYHLKTPLLLINRNRLLIYCIELWYCEWLPISLTCMQCYRPRLNLHYIDWHRHGNPMPVRSSPTYILQTFLQTVPRKKTSIYCTIHLLFPSFSCLLSMVCLFLSVSFHSDFLARYLMGNISGCQPWSCPCLWETSPG